MGEYQIDIVKDYNSLKNLREDWNRLASNDPSIYPFICFEWFDLWFRAFGKTNLIHIYLLKNAKRICAIIPFIKYYGAVNGIPGSIIQFAVNDHSNKIDIISDKQDVSRYVERVMAELVRENFLMIYFEDFYAESESVQVILSFLENNGYKFIHDKKFIRESVIIDLKKRWDDLKAGLSKRFNNNINNKMNRLKRAGELQVVKYTAYEELPNAFNCIEKISSKSWQGKNSTGLFSKEDTKIFYKGLAEYASNAGWLSIWVLYLDSKPIAYEYHLTAGSVEYALKAEYDQEYSELSPGSVLDAYVVKEVSKGFAEKYDLLGYKDLYKTRWSNKTEKYMRLYIYKRNLIGTLSHFIEFPLRARLSRYTLLRRVKDYCFRN